MLTGRRREALGAGVASLLDEFWPVLLPYDGAAASIYAELAQEDELLADLWERRMA